MSYPKSHPVNKSRTSSFNDQTHHHLIKQKQRQQLKSLLINKFKRKYGFEIKLIQKEIDDFMKTQSVTQANLLKLDQKFQQKAKTISAKAQTHSRASSRVSTPRNSQSRTSTYRSSARSSSMFSSTQRTQYKPEVDDIQWAAILDHDTFLYREQERARIQREKQEKIRLRKELDRQLEDKMKKKQRQIQDDRLYNQAYQANYEMMNQKQKEREQEYRQKVIQEKKLRDRQRYLQIKKKKALAQEQSLLDRKLVQKIQEEIEAEKQMLLNRKIEQRRYMKQVIAENERNKLKLMEQKANEKKSDVRDMHNYARMLDQQEADRQQALKERQDRQQFLMARMAGTILKQQHKKNLQEDLLMLQQIQEKQDFDRKVDERRLRSRQAKELEVKKYLDQQVLDKKRRRSAQYQEFNQQSEMWRREASQFYKDEEDKKKRDKEMNVLHGHSLKLQIEENQARRVKRRYLPVYNVPSVHSGFSR